MRVLLNAVFLLILALEGVAVISVVLWRWWWWCSCIIGSWSTGMASASLTFCCIWDAGKKYEVSSRTKLWRVHLKVISKGSWIVLFWVFLVLVFCSVGVRCHKKSIHWEVIYRLKKKKKKRWSWRAVYNVLVSLQHICLHKFAGNHIQWH